MWEISSSCRTSKERFVSSISSRFNASKHPRLGLKRLFAVAIECCWITTILMSSCYDQQSVAADIPSCSDFTVVPSIGGCRQLQRSTGLVGKKLYFVTHC